MMKKFVLYTWYTNSLRSAIFYVQREKKFVMSKKMFTFAEKLQITFCGKLSDSNTSQEQKK